MHPCQGEEGAEATIAELRGQRQTVVTWLGGPYHAYRPVV